ncbi:MAG: HugZ family pyridoxamine 5'-phosphate oxidase [Hyphomicrobiales bacterium]
MMERAGRFTGPEARLLLRRALTATIASLDRGGGGAYASLANVASDVDGAPIVLISKLAWHTQNLMADGRGSLMVAELPEVGDALTGQRVTVMGHWREAAEPRLRRRYLARHPGAELYVDFGDFSFWRLTPQVIHAVAGFGRIETLSGGQVFPPAAEIEALEESAIAHLNEDHAGAPRLYATKLLDACDGEWKAAAVDCDGADLVLGGRSLRLAFPEPVYTADALRQSLVALAAKARTQ